MEAATLQKQYKEHLSDFYEWETQFPDEVFLVYPENFGKRMSIDEVALSNGELYTIITNKDKKGRKGCLAALIRGTKAEVVNTALEKVPVEIRFAVKEITLDLANTMDWICRTSFPFAIRTADRFHFQKVVTDGVQDIRIKLRRKAIDEYNLEVAESKKRGWEYIAPLYSNGDTKKQLLARGRYLLFKPKTKWTASQWERAAILFDQFPELKKAYDLSMYFRGIFESSKTREQGKERLQTWYKKISQTGLPDLESAANTIATHEGVILNYFRKRETNASAESFNAKLKGFRALLRGVRDINFFLFRIEKLYT